MVDNFAVSISIEETISLLDKGLSNVEKIDCHTVMNDDDKKVVLLIYEKYFIRSKCKITLSITLDNIKGYTSIHCVSSGGSNLITTIDWGVHEEFISDPKRILKYQIVF